MKMITLKSLLAALVISMAAAPQAFAAGASVPLLDAKVDLSDKLSMARGAKYFANYCMGCHSLKFSRYNRVAADLGLDEKAMQAIIFTRDDDGEMSKTGDLMENAIPVKDSARWFGAPPPDLSLVARSRPGGDWIYSFLRGFYKDESRPMGFNNTVFKNVGMPFVLSDLQGIQTMEEVDDGKGHKSQVLTLAEKGSMSEADYDQVARDLTNFLVYVGEPAQLSRTFYGIFTMLFLLVFFVVAYLLKKEFWKDIH